MRTSHRNQARDRLERVRFDLYCREADLDAARWPSRSFLEALVADVRSLSATNRVSWKTFQRLDERVPALRLALKVDNLVNRALARLKEAPQATPKSARSLIQWLVKIDHERVEELTALNRAARIEVKDQIRLDQGARWEKKREAARLRKKRERLQKRLRQKSVTLNM